MNKRRDLRRGAIGKQAVIGAVERAGRVTAALIDGASQAEIHRL